MARTNRGEDDYKGDNYDDLVRQNVMDEMDPNGGQQKLVDPPPPGFAAGGSQPPPADPGGQPGTIPQATSDPSTVGQTGTIPQASAGTQPDTSQGHGYYRPDGGWQETGLGGATAPITSPGRPVASTSGQSGGGANSMGLPPELAQIFDQLRSGLTGPSVPQVSQPSQVTPAYSELLRNSIMSAIQEGQRPVDASDPMVAPMIASLNNRSQRAKEDNQGRVAEQLAAHHLLSSGAYDTSVERYNQGVDESASNSQAQMMTQVLGQRQQRLMQAIQMGSNYLNADQARQLQSELANVNAALQQYQAKSSVGLSLLESLLRNNQFYDSLGLQAGEFASGQNANAVGF